MILKLWLLIPSLLQIFRHHHHIQLVIKLKRLLLLALQNSQYVKMTIFPHQTLARQIFRQLAL